MYPKVISIVHKIRVTYSFEKKNPWKVIWWFTLLVLFFLPHFTILKCTFRYSRAVQLFFKRILELRWDIEFHNFPKYQRVFPKYQSPIWKNQTIKINATYTVYMATQRVTGHVYFWRATQQNRSQTEFLVVPQWSTQAFTTAIQAYLSI